MLALSTYDKVERQAKSRLPNSIIQTFSPVAFQTAGYPTRINDESELSKYIDVMHDLRFERDYENLLVRITDDEFKLLQRLTSLVFDFNRKYFRRRAIARASILRSLHVLRHLKFIYGKDRRPNILEIGPGCGYLAAMLLLEGYPYVATDVTQAFYLYQNHFWNFITDGGIIEWVEKSKHLLTPVKGKAVHIPWWDFAKLKPDQMMASSVVTCNHAISEMHPNSLRHMLRLAQRAQTKVNSEPISFIIDGFYPTSINPLEDIMESFYHFGYTLVHHDAKITIFAPAGTSSSYDGLQLPRSGRTLLNIPQDILRKLAGLPSLYRHRQWKVREYSSHNNIISLSIQSGRNTLSCKDFVPIERVNEFYTDLLGNRDHRSADEQFLDEIIWMK